MGDDRSIFCRLAALPVLLLTAAVAISCNNRYQPPPPYAWDTGHPEINPIQRPVTIEEPVATANENQVVESPSHQVDDQFGASVALALDTLVVGAPNTVGGGAAWVFDLTEGGAPPLKLVPPKLAPGDACGSAVAISESGRFIAVGSPRKEVDKQRGIGAVHVWEKMENVWTFAGTYSGADIPADSLMGSTVAISDDTLLAGAPFAPYEQTMAHGAVATWMRDLDGQWIENVTLAPDPSISNARFGGAMSLRGTLLIVGAAYGRAADQAEGGIAYIFQRRRTGWPMNPICQIMDIASLSDPSDVHVNFDRGPGNHFGWAVSVLGNVAIVGSPDQSADSMLNNGSVSIFKYEANATWSKIQFISALDRQSCDAFGSAVGIAATQFVIGAPLKPTKELAFVGATYVYQIVPGSNPPVEEFVIKLLPSKPRQGGRMGAALSCTADMIAVSAPGPSDRSAPGAIYLFRRSENSWGVPAPEAKPMAPPADVAPVPKPPPQPYNG
ncbi:MAG: FG-GAP repeat protein [Planctomycetes bacterium]|nr:FG-GAP repeat protein [Planctomycetota bacterium]